MTFMEAKAIAGAETVIRIFEESHNCKLPEEVKEETRQEWIRTMRPFQDWIENVCKKDC
jgi:hypothetical protein